MYRASAELLSHIEPTSAVGAPLPRRASSREAAETWDGQTSKGQSEEEGRSPFHRCFLQTRKSQRESYRDQAQKSSLCSARV